ncbi:MAG: TerC family protein [Hyphomicrobiales bacterium]|jgi:YjbE family integral membrane protein|nr:TerC family protein [Hyphomicrobiales bacterium]
MWDSLTTYISSLGTVGKVIEIIALNIVLSGDNAVVIALACRGLPPAQRSMGIALGAGVAVVLRVIFTVIIASLLNMPFLRIVGACLLIWIAIKLLTEEPGDEEGVAASDKLWKAVQTVAIADIVMSLDNVLAIAAVAKDSLPLLITGLVISIPLIVAGASLITRLLERFPILIWAGAGLLGWVAGEMLDSDPFLIGQFGTDLLHKLEYPAAIVGALIVLGGGYVIRRRRVAHERRLQPGVSPLKPGTPT